VLDAFFLSSAEAKLIEEQSKEKLEEQSSIIKTFFSEKFIVSSEGKGDYLKDHKEKLLVVFKDLRFFVWNFDRDQFCLKNFGKVQMPQDTTDLEFSCVELASCLIKEKSSVIKMIGDKRGVIHVNLLQEGLSQPIYIKKRLHSNSITSLRVNHYEESGQMLWAASSYDRKLSIFRIKTDQQNSPKSIIEVVMRFK
jgi:hypothetical protein